MDSAGAVFWTTGGGEIVSLEASQDLGDTPRVLVAMESPTTSMRPPAISAAEHYVFWAETLGEFEETGRVFRVTKATGSRELVMSTTPRGAGAVGLHAISDSQLIIRLGNGRLFEVSRIPFGMGFLWVEEGVASTAASAFVVGNDRLYWAETAVGGSLAIRSAPLSDLTNDSLHHTIAASGSPQVRDLAVDSEAIYWHEVRSSSGPLSRKRFDGATAEPITSNLPVASADRLYLSSDSRHLFWKASPTTIRKLPVNAAAVTYDLAATGLEVVQAVQSDANDVPLVMGKTTWVRLYGQLLSSTSGTSRVQGWPMARLHGEKAGTPLPGSPLTPVGREGPLFDRNHDRTRAAEGYWFRLPESWTFEGAVTLRGEINPAGVISESDLGNNSISQAADFVRKAPICVVIEPLRTHQGTIRRYRREYQRYFDLAEAMLPCSSLRIYWDGGASLEEFELTAVPPFFTYGPYELTDDDEDDLIPESFWILEKLWMRSVFGDDPDRCDLHNAATHHAALFIPFTAQAYNGIGGTGSDNLIAQLDLSGSTFDSPLGAVTFAHELGHNYSRDHVDCPVGDPDDPDPAYPYGCMISAGSHLGLNPLTQRLIQPTEAGDLMSYAHRLVPPLPRWPSDYTWGAIFNELDLRPASMLSPPLGETPGGRRLMSAAAPDAPSRSVIFGAVGAGGHGTLEPALQLIDEHSLARALEKYARPGDEGSLQLRIYNTAGGLLRTSAAKAFKTADHNFLFLMAIIEDDPAAARIELVSAAAPATPLASLTGGGQPPHIEILEPVAGAVINGELSVRWSSLDPEGNPLRHTVRYSHNGGAAWRVIAEQFAGREIRIETDGLPGTSADNCLVEVLASDGLVTSSARSMPFRLKSKEPTAFIFIETERGKNFDLTAVTVPAGEDLVLHAEAYDAEEGSLEEGMAWSLSGPVPRIGTGQQFHLRDLRPGTYPVTLTATDVSGASGSAATQIIVKAKSVPEAASAPTLDGVLDDPAYESDFKPLELRYPGGQVAYVRLIHAGGALHVGISGMFVGQNNRQFAALSIDRDNSGGAFPQATDFRLATYADGGLSRQIGNGSTFVEDTPPAGFAARVLRHGPTWNAEFRVADALLGGWSGQTIGLDIAHINRGGTDQLHWFDGAAAIASQPGAWADVRLAADASDPFDGDRDGLADAWEIANFGKTTADGTADTDRDGQTDAEEFQAATDPHSAASRFAVSQQRVANGQIQISWPAAGDRLYSIEASEDLVTFIPIVTSIAGEIDHLEFTLPLPQTVGRHFYRVVVRGAW